VVAGVVAQRCRRAIFRHRAGRMEAKHTYAPIRNRGLLSGFKNKNVYLAGKNFIVQRSFQPSESSLAIALCGTPAN
jgi:hypothetical protein